MLRRLAGHYGRTLSSAAVKAFLIVLVRGIVAEAAEVKVLSSTAALAPVMNEFVPQFERTTGHKVTIRYEFGPVLIREIEAGAMFDVAILSLDAEGLIKRGKIAAGTRAVLGRTAVGVGVRKGAPRPDISTPEAFKRTLLDAKSVAHSADGSSGRYFLGLLDRLGIAEDMKAKLKPQPIGNSPAQAVGTGQAEIAVTGIAIILAVPGAELVGSLPSELQSYVLFTGFVGVAAKKAEAGRALLNFLTTPEAAAAFKARGVEPVVP
jgi:molybdate transport system substrate-binding protein